MPRDAAGEAHRAAGGDHRLRRDAVPQVRGAADDVALDHRDLGAEPRRVRGRRVAGRPAADDHESHRHGRPRLRSPSGRSFDATRHRRRPSSSTRTRRAERLRRSVRTRRERAVRRSGSTADGYGDLVAALADPLEVHAVGASGSCRPRRSRARGRCARRRQFICGHAALRSWRACSCRAPCPRCGATGTRCCR